MLTDLTWLEQGKPFPPKCERQRLEMYAHNRALFECEHADEYELALRRIERVIGNFNEVVSYPIVLNFQKLMSLKIADLLFGEPPKIVAGDPETAEQKAIEAISESSDLLNTLFMAGIDVSRFGDGLLYVRKMGDAGVIELTQPSFWFPIADPENISRIQAHVLAWTFKEGDNEYLKVYVHRKGAFDEYVYALSSGAVGKQIDQMVSSTLNQKTGLADFAIIPVHNTITSDRVTGIDDYTDIDSLIAELMVRVGQVSRILDKHASPSVQGPQAALEQDPVTSEWRLKMGNYFPRDNKEDPPVEYITWDGELESNFKQIERLINMLYTISEMGSAIFGDLSSKTGEAPSGTALRRLMVSPLAKVQRIRMRFDAAIKKALKLCSQLGGKGVVDLTDKPIAINWQDGLPGDPLEEAQIMQFRTASKATMSQHRALKVYDGMTDKEADEEVARIQDEEAAANPMVTPPFSQGEPSEPAEE
jgi:hypothetical protein